MKQGWEIKKLSEIGKVFNGNSINEKVKKDKYTGLDDGLPFIATKDVGFDSEIDYENGVRIPFNEINQFKIAPSNTPLICAEGGSAGRKIGFTNQDVCFGNKLFALVPNKNVDSKYIYYYYFTSSFQKHFSTEMAGIIGGVSMNKFKDIEIPLPPLPEQHRIVSILDEAFAAIAKAKANAERCLSLSKALFESYLQRVFGSTGSPTEKKGGALSLSKRDGWEEKKLGEVCEIVNGGTPKTGHSEYWDGDIEWITPADLGKLKSITVDNTSRKITELGLQKSSAKLFPENSVVLSTRAPIGHLAINTVPMSSNQGCRGIIPSKKINVWYLYYYLKINVKLLDSLGTGATFKELSASALKNVTIPFPKSIEAQQTIVRQLDALRAETQKLEAVYQQKIADLEELKKSILQKAFAGELPDRQAGLRNPEGATYDSEVASPLAVNDGHRPSDKKRKT